VVVQPQLALRQGNSRGRNDHPHHEPRHVQRN
jgi:hypothetical protein